MLSSSPLILVPGGSCRIALLNPRRESHIGCLVPMRDQRRCHLPIPLLLDLVMRSILSRSDVLSSGHSSFLLVV